MSDHYYNYLTMSGCSKKIAEVKKYLKTKEPNGTFIEYDMGKIIPVPDELNEKMNGRSSKLESLLMSKNKKVDVDILLKEVEAFKSLSHSERLWELNYAVDLLKCKDKYHFSNYVDWSYQNRGFKSIEEGEYIPGSKTICFLTTNGNGIKVIQKLAKMFPEVVFELKYDLEFPDDGYGLLEVRDFNTLKFGEFHYMSDPNLKFKPRNTYDD